MKNPLRNVVSVGLFGVSVLALAPGAVPAVAQERVSASPALASDPVVRDSVHNDVTPRKLRDLAAAAPRVAAAGSQDADVEVPLLLLSHGDDGQPDTAVTLPAPKPRRPQRGVVAPRVSPLAPSAPSSLVPSASVNFEAIRQADNVALLGRTVTPPDPNGAVSPDLYVEWVNLLLAVFDRQGNLVFGPVPGNSLWQGFGAPCETTNNGDPIVIWDKYAERWLFSQFALPNGSAFGPYYQCLAVSQTSDPTGAYNRYVFTMSDTLFNDYPHFGVWPDGYYMSFHNFQPNPIGGFFYAGAGMAAFERDKMLLGMPARMVVFNAGGQFGGHLPADADGPVLPPAGSPGYFVEWDKGSPTCTGGLPFCLNIFRLHVDWNNPFSSTLSGPQSTRVDPFENRFCTAPRGACVPQPDTAQRLEVISDRLMYRLQYRNFLGYETLVANHTVNVGVFQTAPQAGVRWYELRKSPAVTSWSVFQQGTYAPDDDNRWMASAAMDRDGNIAVGFSVSSQDTHPSIRYATRQRSDPAGELSNETSIVEGSGSQLEIARWGDYTSMALDAFDDCTFWYTGEYYQTSSARGWQTRVAAFPSPTCPTS